MPARRQRLAAANGLHGTAVRRPAQRSPDRSTRPPGVVSAWPGRAGPESFEALFSVRPLRLGGGTGWATAVLGEGLRTRGQRLPGFRPRGGRRIDPGHAPRPGRGSLRASSTTAAPRTPPTPTPSRAAPPHRPWSRPCWVPSPASTASPNLR
ncbi:hypothetical protein LV779_05990 [Streptomyces thinghirensis]|nr:hypothetical protein [Streptomyces thinghirensis]